MNDFQAMVQAVLDSPRDAVLRGILADFLEEQGMEHADCLRREGCWELVPEGWDSRYSLWWFPLRERPSCRVALGVRSDASCSRCRHSGYEQLRYNGQSWICVPCRVRAARARGNLDELRGVES